MQVPCAYRRCARNTKGLFFTQSEQVTRNLLHLQWHFHQNFLVPQRALRGHSILWLSLDTFVCLVFFISRSISSFSIKKAVMPQQLALRLEPVLSHYVRPSVRATQKGSRPFPGSIFLFSHNAFICHTMKYRSICYNLFCQSRWAQSHPRLPASWQVCWFQRL